MATRALIKIKDHNIALYRHHDGYPQGPHGVLSEDFKSFVKGFSEDRGNDPKYFIARLAMFQIKSTGQEEKLTGFGIVDLNDCDDWGQEFTYNVDLEKGEVSL